MAVWQDAELDERSTSSGRATTAAAIEPWSFGGGYVNYMQADEPIERVRAAFGDEAFERLQALKRDTTRTTSCAATRTSHPARGDARRRIDLTAQASCRS